MKTKISFTESVNIAVVSAQLKHTYVEICKEWRQDLNKDGHVKLHSKAHKAMNKLEQAIYALEKLKELLECEV